LLCTHKQTKKRRQSESEQKSDRGVVTLLTFQPEAAGVAPEILVRANEILELMTETKNIERLDSQQTAAKDQRYKVCLLPTCSSLMSLL